LRITRSGPEGEVHKEQRGNGGDENGGWQMANGKGPGAEQLKVGSGDSGKGLSHKAALALGGRLTSFPVSN
jgi:hypothetical protein